MGSNAKKYMSVLEVIALSIVLLTGMSLMYTMHIGAYGQQQQPKQQTKVGLSQIINNIAQQVATANPGTNATHVQQILIQLAKETAAQTGGKEQAINEILQISSQVTTYPFGTISQSLSHLAKQLAAGSSGSSSLTQIAQQIIKEKSSTGKSVSQAIVNIAVQAASGASSNNINLIIRQTAQKIANQTGVSVEKIESIIIQIALQIAQAQGKAVTGQTIFEIANQIAQNPNGILAQALLQLVKQDAADNGKTSQTVKIINNVVKSGGGNSKTIVKVIGDREKGDGKPRPPPPPTCKPGYHWDAIAKKCVPNIIPPAPDPCIENPDAEGCPPAPDPCIKNPDAEGCEPTPPPPSPCEEDLTAEGCEDPQSEPEEADEEEADEEESEPEEEADEEESEPAEDAIENSDEEE